MNLHSLRSARKQLILYTDFLKTPILLFLKRYLWKLLFLTDVYHIWSDFSSSICILPYTDSDSYVFISSLCNEGGSDRMSFPSTENHMKFSALKILCPVESPPLHAFRQQSSMSPLTTAAHLQLVGKKLLYHPNRWFCLILVDIPMRPPLTP